LVNNHRLNNFYIKKWKASWIHHELIDCFLMKAYAYKQVLLHHSYSTIKTLLQGWSLSRNSRIFYVTFLNVITDLDRREETKWNCSSKFSEWKKVSESNSFPSSQSYFKIKKNSFRFIPAPNAWMMTPTLSREIKFL